MKFTTVMFLWGMTVAAGLWGVAWVVQPRSASRPPAVVSSPFVYAFEAPDTLYEAGSIDESSSPYWWVNAGGALTMEGNAGSTIQGDVPLLNRWRIAYALANPLDTDGGRHPQNIFRLVARSSWKDVSQSVRVFITADHLSRSPNRNQSNGVFLMSRYEDGQTLYYAGVRVDGSAVIKKKYHGVYYTLAQEPVFPGVYGSDTSDNLLPHGAWLALRSDTRTNTDGSVTVALFLRQQGSDEWVQVIEAVDAGGAEVAGTPPISGSGHTGIRTDFMDVRFADYRAETIAP